MENTMVYSASFQRIVIYTGHKIQLTLLKTGESNACEPVCRALGCSCLQVLPVHKYWVSCKAHMTDEKGSCGAFSWCYSPSHPTTLPLYRSNSTEPCGFEGKEMCKLCGWCGLMRILFLFLLRKQLALRSSALYKNGCVPFSRLPVEWVYPFSARQHAATGKTSAVKLFLSPGTLSPDLAHSCLWLLLHLWREWCISFVVVAWKSGFHLAQGVEVLTAITCTRANVFR